jgi:fermentation-respiration switch protein FrsA (DUF1100 family)
MKISGITYVSRKTHTGRKVFIILLVLILLVVIATMVYSTIIGWNLTHPAKRALTTPAFASGNAPHYQDVAFKDKSKSVTLSGWYFRAKNSVKTIILAHGYGMNRQQFGQQMITGFINKGFNVLTFDFRNSGESGGSITSVGYYEKDDLLGAIQYVKSQIVKHIVLLGFSMGASTSIIAASESPDVDGVIADSPFANLGEYLNKQLPVWSKVPDFPFNLTIMASVRLMTGLDPSKVSPRDSIVKFSPRPVLLIHSKDDTAISVDNSKELYNIYHKVAGSNAEFWETSGVDHVGSYDAFPSAYMAKVYAFLDKACP